MNGTLYIVSLPIGNELDISLNATNVLKKADIVACEDTRIFKALCKKLSIKYNKLISYHKYNENSLATKILSSLKKGLSICLVSDAGTPRVSDPGCKLVSLCYENDIEVKAIPGCSAVTTALSLCPFKIDSYLFAGFPAPETKKREDFFKSISDYPSLIVLFEAPHRLIKHLHSAKKIFNRNLFVARELTKKYEQKIFGSIDEIINHFENKNIKGEFVLIYSKPVITNLTKKEIEQIALKQNKPTKVLAKELKPKSNLSTSSIYKIINDVKKSK